MTNVFRFISLAKHFGETARRYYAQMENTGDKQRAKRYQEMGDTYLLASNQLLEAIIQTLKDEMNGGVGNGEKRSEQKNL